MELLRKNIHMDVTKCQVESRITLEDDVNLADYGPDMEKIILEDGTAKIEEIKTSADHVLVRGRLFVEVLYLTDDRDAVVSGMEGAVSFEEKIYMEGIQSGSHVEGTAEVEDLSIGLINSRKISVRSLLKICLKQQEIVDEETAVEISCEEPVEYRKKMLNYTGLSVCKKDIYRIRQEMELPGNFPNIFNLIWKSVKVCSLEFKALDEKISLQGNLQAFFLYEGEGEDNPIRFYECVIPFSGVVEEKNSRELMIANISHSVGNLEVEVKPDFDGEERVFSMEVVLDLDIKLYEEQQIEMLADVYGVTKEVTAVSKNGAVKHLLLQNNGRCRVNGKLKTQNGSKNILQVLYGMGTPVVEETNLLPDAVEINGYIMTKCLYVTSDDLVPYDAVSGKIPFQYTLDAAGIASKEQMQVQVVLEQLETGMANGEEVEVKAIVQIKVLAFEEQEIELIHDVKMEELDSAKLKKLPQMVVHVAKEGDSLWQIGKKYYVPVSSIREINEMNQDECKMGQKILVVR